MFLDGLLSSYVKQYGVSGWYTYDEDFEEIVKIDK
jgi:predicted nucleic acid-binding protein